MVLEQIILGIIQGITEWLPVSSKSFLLLAQVNLFGHTDASVESLLHVAVTLHIGTFCAALVYLRDDVMRIVRTLFSYKSAPYADKNLVHFLVITTLISGLMGLGTLTLLSELEDTLALTGKMVTGAVGLLLLITGVVQLRTRSQRGQGMRTAADITWADGIIAGIAQGIATIPGFSRSGMTMAALLLRAIDDVHALRLSFLMSLPIVLLGNIVLEIRNFSFAPVQLIGISVSFVVGLISMHALLTLARRVNFGYFVIGFGVVVFLAALA